MRSLHTFTLGLLLLLCASSCATLTRGSTDTVIVRTQPAGATVSLSNGMYGMSPVTFELPRNESVLVNICKEGYQPVDVSLNPVMSGEGGAGMAGNILAGGIIGVIVDADSGAMYDLTPNPLEVTLIPLDGYADPYQGHHDAHLRAEAAIREEWEQDLEDHHYDLMDEEIDPSELHPVGPNDSFDPANYQGPQANQVQNQPAPVQNGAPYPVPSQQGGMPAQNAPMPQPQAPQPEGWSEAPAPQSNPVVNPNAAPAPVPSGTPYQTPGLAGSGN